MATFTLTNVGLLIDSLAVDGFANQLNLEASADEQDITTLRSGGWRRKLPGLGMFTISTTGFQDYATTGVDPVFPVTGVGGLNYYAVSPAGGDSVGDPTFFGSGRLNAYTPLTGQVGTVAGFTYTWGGTGRLVRGQMLHPVAARTATGTGTAAAFTAPTAAQTLYAGFHVLAVSGSGSITFKIQTDDNSGFTSATDRITSSAFTAVGAGSGSLAGALAGETHVRAAWTISGFTSVTFAVVAGVA